MERKLRLEQESFQRFQLQKHSTAGNQLCTGHTTDLIGRQSCTVRKVINTEDHFIQSRRRPPRRQLRSGRLFTNTDDRELDSDRKSEISMFCRPGRHHFFFIRDGKHFMLSNKYGRERYKQTNVVMNFVDVAPRGWQVLEPMVDRDAEWNRLC